MRCARWSLYQAIYDAYRDGRQGPIEIATP